MLQRVISVYSKRCKHILHNSCGRLLHCVLCAGLATFLQLFTSFFTALALVLRILLHNTRAAAIPFALFPCVFCSAAFCTLKKSKTFLHCANKLAHYLLMLLCAYNFKHAKQKNALNARAACAHSARSYKHAVKHSAACKLCVVCFSSTRALKRNTVAHVA